MKKLKLIMFIGVLGVFLYACNKEQKNVSNESHQQETPDLTKIDGKDIQNILSQLNSNADAPPWWEKVKKWVHDRTGTSQQYVNGQPVCHGNGGCGPCPGIGCVFGGIAFDEGNDGVLTELEVANGLKLFKLAVIERMIDNDLRVMLEFDDNQYIEEFIDGNGYLKIEDSGLLNNELTNGLGYNSIYIYAGQYPVFLNEDTGSYQTVLNSVVE